MGLGMEQPGWGRLQTDPVGGHRNAGNPRRLQRRVSRTPLARVVSLTTGTQIITSSV